MLDAIPVILLDLIENEEWDQAMGLYNAKVLPVCTKKDWRELPKEGFDIIAGKGGD